MSSPPTQLQIETTYLPPNAATLPKTVAGHTLSMHYTGTLYSDGTKFDSSEKRDPLKFQLGAGRVIRGWDEGLVGMVKGEKRKLVIPHGLAYGDRGYPPKIPPKSALVFEVELVDFV